MIATQADSDRRQRRLAACYNRATRYEVTASHPDGRRYLLGYFASVRRGAFLSTLRANGPAWLALLDNLTGNDACTFIGRAGQAGYGLTLGPWTIARTSRTERQAIIEGEIPFPIGGAQ